MTLTSIAERASLRRDVLALGFCLALACPAAMAAPAPEVVIRFAHVVAPDTPKGQMVQHFAALVAQRSAGRVQVKVFADSQLYGDEDEMEALRLGAVEMLAPSLSKFGPIGLPEFEVFDLPFLFADAGQVQRLMYGPVGQRLMASLERRQMQGLGFLDNGFKHMSAHRALRTPADFRGLRLRVQSSAVLVAQMQALGARAVPLPFGETRQALASAVVDGTENPLSNFLTQDLAPLQPHITLTRHGYLGYVVVTNARFWARLTTADREVVRQSLEDALVLGNQKSADIYRQAQDQLARMPGVHLYALTPQERAVLRQAAQPAYAVFEKSVEPTFMRAVRSTLDFD